MINNKHYGNVKILDQEMRLGQKNIVLTLTDFIPRDINNILDVGCGDGKTAHALMKATGLSITGLDSSHEALARCQFETVNSSAEKIPFMDGTFDLVMTIDTLEHLSDKEEINVINECFRVAKNIMVIVVPFEEELLETTTKCIQCSNKYHISLHKRAYSWSELIKKKPINWKVGAIILSGEHWPNYHPIETHFRRNVLNEWSGFENIYCPQCNFPCSKQIISNIQEADLAELGSKIYTERRLDKDRLIRHSSEIVVIYHNNKYSFQVPLVCIAEERRQNLCEAILEDISQNQFFYPFPENARTILDCHGKACMQFPVYSRSRTLVIKWKKFTIPKEVTIILTDLFGIVYSGNISPNSERETNIQLSRNLTPDYCGVTVTLSCHDQIESISIGAFFKTTIKPPQKSIVAYKKLYLRGVALFIQTAEIKHIDMNILMKERPIIKKYTLKTVKKMKQKHYRLIKRFFFIIRKYWRSYF